MPRVAQGILVPLVTPLTQDFGLDETALAQLVARVIAGGVNGIFLLGTCGESASLSMGLKQELTRRVCALADGRVAVVVNVTATAAADVQTLAECAAKAGAAALVLGPPFYFPLTQAELAGYFQRMVPSLALPVYLYNYPSLFKTAIELETLNALRGLRRLAGLKDSSGDLEYFKRVRAAFPGGSGFGLYCGPDELLMETLDLGADGGVSGGANLFPELYAALFQAHQRGDRRALLESHQMVLEICRGIYAPAGGSAGAVRGLKYALAELGISNGVTAEPLGPIATDLVARIAANVRALEKRLLERAA